MVHDMMGQAGGHVALIKSVLPKTSCPETSADGGRSWSRKLMEDVTDHTKYFKSTVSRNGAVLCCFLSLQRVDPEPNIINNMPARESVRRKAALDGFGASARVGSMQEMDTVMLRYASTQF